MVLDGELAEAKKTYAVFASEAAVQSSECERKAVEAERDVDDLYKVMYMSNHIGEEFEGVISGVTAYGVFVELNNTVEGFVSLNSLPLDEYEFLEERFLLRGKKQAFGMGDSLKIQVAGCDFGNREIDFEFLEKIN